MPAFLKRELIESIGLQLGRPVDSFQLYDAVACSEGCPPQALKGMRLLGDNPTFARLLTRLLMSDAY